MVRYSIFILALAGSVAIGTGAPDSPSNITAIQSPSAVVADGTDGEQPKNAGKMSGFKQKISNAGSRLKRSVSKQVNKLSSKNKNKGAESEAAVEEEGPVDQVAEGPEEQVVAEAPNDDGNDENTAVAVNSEDADSSQLKAPKEEEKEKETEPAPPPPRAPKPPIGDVMADGFFGALVGGPVNWISDDLYQNVFKAFLKSQVARLKESKLLDGEHRIPYRISIVLGYEIERYLRKFDVRKEANPKFYETSQVMLTSYMRLIWDQYPFPSVKIVTWRALFEFYRTLRPHLEGMYELEALYGIITDPRQKELKLILDKRRMAIIQSSGDPSFIRSACMALSKKDKISVYVPRGLKNVQFTIKRFQDARTRQAGSPPKPAFLSTDFEGKGNTTTLSADLFKKTKKATAKLSKSKPKFVV